MAKNKLTSNAMFHLLKKGENVFYQHLWDIESDMLQSVAHSKFNNPGVWGSGAFSTNISKNKFIHLWKIDKCVDELEYIPLTCVWA